MHLVHWVLQKRCAPIAGNRKLIKALTHKFKFNIKQLELFDKISWVQYH